MKQLHETVEWINDAEESRSRENQSYEYHHVVGYSDRIFVARPICQRVIDLHGPKLWACCPTNVVTGRDATSLRFDTLEEAKDQVVRWLIEEKLS